MKEGNQCLFLMFISFNFALLLSSLGVLGCAIYLWVISSKFNIFVMFFFFSGLLLLLLTTCSFKLRKSIHLIRCYLILQFMIFTCMLIFSLVLLFNRDNMIAWAKRRWQELKEEDPDTTEPLDEYQEVIIDHV